MMLKISRQQISRLIKSGRLLVVSPDCGGTFVMTKSIKRHYRNRMRRLKRQARPS
jgi:hypothetical protein